ncbi:MAG: hypothetical protein J3K34DRAFT_519278 [Monoraphidium minutum]|nr:MAG: hypothetical protein J3K34DRAFT_519278 [Monoraphidium minutum]
MASDEQAGTGLLGLPRLRKVAPCDDGSSGSPSSARSAHHGCADRAAARASAAAAAACSAAPPLSPVSQMFLGMGEQAPDIYAILRLRGHASLDEIAPAMRQLVDAHERFRLRVAFRAGAWRTEVLEEFDVRWCMREVTLPGPDVDVAFNTFVAGLMSGAPLAEGHLPPWDCSVVHYASAPRVTDVLLRCSHMIGDGQLFMQLLKDVLEEVDDGPGSEVGGSEVGGLSSEGASEGALSSPSSSSSSLSGLVGGGAAGAAGGAAPPLIRAVRGGSAFLPPPSMERAEREGAHRRRRPGGEGGRPRARGGAWRRFWKLLLAAWSWVSSAMFVCMMPFRMPDPVNAVKAAPGEIGGPRAFASVVLPLDELRHVSKVLGVTINTLAVSCLAGGLRRHLLASGGGGARAWPWRRGGGAAGGGVPSSLLLCSMVDTRAMKRMGFVGGGGGCNTLSFIGVPVLTGPAPPLARLAAAAASLAWIRGSLAILIAVLIPPVLQLFLRDVGLATRLIMWMLPAKTSLGFSNMRGPVKPVALRGYPVERMYNGVQPNAFGCFISLMSYADQVTIVNSCYVSKSSHPEKLLACVRDEWAALRDAATMLPAPPAADGAGGALGGGGAAAKAKAE